MIRVVVVDDGVDARERLIRAVSKHEGFEVVSDFAGGAEALDYLKTSKVDVAFLDVEMPHMSGLDLASHLAHLPTPPMVVFVTAHDQYAIEAFEANAIDYILKPFRETRLGQTLTRIEARLASKDATKEKLLALESNLLALGKLKRIVGYRRGSKSRMMIDPKNVFYFEAKLKEVHAQLEREDYIIHSTLQEVLDVLDPSQFVQTHRAYLVNIEKVERLEPMFKGDYEMILSGKAGMKVPLSRTYVASVKTLLSAW
jgi:DNA-binding LytR/AlgR family response regulator